MRPPVPETLLEKTKLVVLRNGAKQIYFLDYISASWIISGLVFEIAE